MIKPEDGNATATPYRRFALVAVNIMHGLGHVSIQGIPVLYPVLVGFLVVHFGMDTAVWMIAASSLAGMVILSFVHRDSQTRQTT